MKVLVFGNEYLGCDSMAVRVSRAMDRKGIEFVHCEDLSQLMAAEGSLNIMDVVEGISEPMVIEDVSRLKVNQSLSLHDLDLAYMLRLLRETGQIKKVRIIGIPMRGDEKKIAEQAEALLPD